MPMGGWPACADTSNRDRDRSALPGIHRRAVATLPIADVQDSTLPDREGLSGPSGFISHRGRPVDSRDQRHN